MFVMGFALKKKEHCHKITLFEKAWVFTFLLKYQTYVNLIQRELIKIFTIVWSNDSFCTWWLSASRIWLDIGIPMREIGLFHAWRYLWISSSWTPMHWFNSLLYQTKFKKLIRRKYLCGWTVSLCVENNEEKKCWC